MSLMKMRQRIEENAVKSWPGQAFRAPPSVGRIVLHSIAATILGSLTVWRVLEGQDLAEIGVLVYATFIFALLAHVNWQRFKEARDEALLPQRILCPSCEASIALSAEERKGGRFSCASCGEDFEITDE